MSEKTYNLGRVVGWSAYEEFLKENPGVDPSVVTQQKYYEAVTYGTTRALALSILPSDWVEHPATPETPVYWSQTVELPGADYGVIPIVGVDFSTVVNPTTGSPEAATLEYHRDTDRNFAFIYKCFASTSDGTPLSNATQQGGYLTFISTTNAFSTTMGIAIFLIVRGLSVNGLLPGTETSEPYFGPEGIIINKTLAGGVVEEVELESFTPVDGTTTAYRVVIHDVDSQGQRHEHVSLSFADASDVRYTLTGTNTDTTTGTDAIDVSLSYDSTSNVYTGYYSWNELVRMMVENKKMKMTFTASSAVSLEEFPVLGTSAKGQYLKFQKGNDTFYGLSFADANGNKYGLRGTDGESNISFSVLSSTSTSTVYKADIMWDDLIKMLLANYKLRLKLQVDKYKPGDAQIIDITEVWKQGTSVTGVYWLPFKFSFGTNVEYRVCAPWDGSLSMSGNCDGWYRVFLKIYPTDFSLATKFDMIVAAYLNNDLTIANPSGQGTFNFKGDGPYFRGDPPAACGARVDAWAATTGSHTYSLINANTFGKNYGRSDRAAIYWGNVPDTPRTNMPSYAKLMGKSLTATDHRSDFGLNLTITGVSYAGETNNDKIRIIDESYAYDNRDVLVVSLGLNSDAATYTWPGRSSMPSKVVEGQTVPDWESDAYGSSRTEFTGVCTTF